MNYNDIGISNSLDWPRIQKLLKIGFFGAFLNCMGDIFLSWGQADESLSGLLSMLPSYTHASDRIVFIAALLGMFGMVLDGLSFFGIYRIIVFKSQKLAHLYRTGIFGYLMFGACGFHVPVCAAVYLYNHVELRVVENFILYFILPSFLLFWIFFLILIVSQIKAFISKNTPYPKGCWIFNPLFGLVLALALNVFGNQSWANALSCAWLGIGCMWTFGGLLVTMPKGRKANKKTHGQIKRVLIS